MSKATRTFWLHYSKPASLKAGATRLTVHHGGVCHTVTNVVITVPLTGRDRKEQPRFVLAGEVMPHEFVIEDGVAYIGPRPPTPAP